MTGIGSVSYGIPGKSTTDPKTLHAAQQFEALLIASMLQASRGEDSWLGSGEESGGSSAIGYAEEHLAQALAAQGGLGIAQMVVAGLDPDQNFPYATAAGQGTAAVATSSAANSSEAL